MVRKRLEKFLGKNSAEKIIYIPLEKIRRNPYQPRQIFDEEELVELAQSIKTYGVVQPIIVRRIENDYQIIAGERRVRACCLLGLREVPAIIQNVDDEKAAAMSLIENLQRRELNYFEEAKAYSVLINVFGMTQEELARKIGKSQSAIANKMRLLKLPEQVRNLISPEIISERHARALLRLDTPAMQKRVLEQIYQEELTVKETEELVEKISQNAVPQEMKSKQSGQSISMIIRDARIFINTIKETVKRAKQTGIDILLTENDCGSEYEIIIRIAKNAKPKKMQV